jgi:hypothetical protein
MDSERQIFLLVNADVLFDEIDTISQGSNLLG